MLLALARGEAGLVLENMAGVLEGCFLERRDTPYISLLLGTRSY